MSTKMLFLAFSKVKNVFDISLVLLTVLLCLVNQAPWYGIGAGTVVSALLLGRMIKLYEGHVLVSYTPGQV